MTTERWEQLLEGATPGPWTGIADEDSTCITTPDGVLIDVDEHWSSCSEADVRLAAHAPAAVAEVIRLRQALEGRIRVWEKVADRLAAQGDNGAELMRIALNQINHILEGEA